MAKRALILIEGSTTGTGLLFVQAARRLGLHPITLSTDPACHDYLGSECTEQVRVDTDSLEALIRECSRLRETYDIAGITSTEEEVYATVGKLCRHFDLPGPNPTSVEGCCDKFLQRQLLARAGVPIPTNRLATKRTEVETSAQEIGLPVILKPAVGSGSCGVRLCRDADELAEHTTYLLGGEHIWRTSPRILVEEFAQGPHYYAQTVGNEVLGIGAADFGPPPHFVYRESTFPAPLTADEHQRIADVSLSSLRALGLGWGPTSIELRWTSRGPVVIEVNPRLGGTPGPQLVQAAFGIDLIAEHIKLVIGEGPNLRRRHLQTAAARNLLTDRDGILDWINGECRAVALSGVVEVKLHVKPKAPIIRYGDYRDPIGYVIAASPDLAQTHAILQNAVDLIDWSITPFSAISEP
ncbi:acetyl-CoA carboxylase biotin carboxylase subunit family protein [Mesorhizobium sp.]|uniref:ATP-grasp domain-containing protein n=1 Tax=Mesorhizobium sp. TaxID=1871066 RepID=UPI000FD6147F|nr:acetyl-CoA carboxylase biotin carboxylase subunit family protein [Mesorhizobium sp.]RUV95765.1 ATP-grasp domain-containing protein [Mesorhizobium sp. M5C.F.Ca.IN.020.14.1.1]RWI36158.1 MAG: ATP-grasp domain-containing protein [Mesorhizobium sp.]RWI63573.1 MAG: ATP-grasp domain-containing protein [Mesorhizobium sp.]RWJ22853.1 MAG: ATP-grasp domain-containing protein [Mesorhizobium sp.]TIQ70097.1 MAG: ATP-grasp domain-containing protein [Mesorhizobium sp.]